MLYEIKSILLGLAVSLAFTMPIDAAQYTVPEGQPRYTRADASIRIMRIRTIVMVIFVKRLILKYKELLKLRYKEIDESLFVIVR